MSSHVLLPAMTDWTDQTVVEGCLNGDTGAWQAMTARYGDLVRRTVRRACARQDPASGGANEEDLASEVFASLVDNDYRRLRQYDPQYPLAAWLRLIARSHALDDLRARRRRRDAESATTPASPSAPDPAAGLDREELRQRLDAAMEALDAPERTILRLYFFADRSCPEIARLLRVPENTVFSTLRRTLEKLRRGLKGCG